MLIDEPDPRVWIAERVSRDGVRSSSQGRHLRAHAPYGAHLAFEDGPSAHPSLLSPPRPMRDAALTALSTAWGTDAVEIGVGGTLPLVALFTDAFPDAAVLVTGVEDPDTRAHGIDESLHLAEFEKACLAEALLLDLLAPLTGSEE